MSAIDVPDGCERALPGGRTRAGWLVGAAALVCLGVVFTVDRTAFVASVRAARHVRWWWLVAAAAAEVASLAAAAGAHRRLIRAAGARIRFRSVLAIAFASTAIAFSVPVAPLPFSASYSFRQYGNRGIGLALAGWALVVLWMTATISLALVLFAGAVVSGSLLAAMAGLATSLVLITPPLALLLALRYPAVRARLTSLAAHMAEAARRRMAPREGGQPPTWARLLARLDRWPDPAAALDDLLARAGSIRVPRRPFAEVFALSLSNWLLDVTCLVFAIRATGSAVPWHGLLLAYGAGLAAGTLWPAPGGLGAVEAAMTAAFVAAGLHAGPALTAVLAYRLMSFWMLLALGWGFMTILARRRPAQNPVPTLHAGP